jgi:hypothetical protein
LEFHRLHGSDESLRRSDDNGGSSAIPSTENGIRVELIPFEIDPTVPATAGKSTLTTFFSANVVTVDP